MLKTANHVVPLTIGVTGHRDIPKEDEPILRQSISNKLLELKSKFPNTPLLVLSGLAEGADRLVVEESIKLGIDFSVVLPMPYDDYIKDFESLESKEIFDNLLSHAHWIETLSENSEASRETHYESLAVYLVRHSNTLMALWDGEKSEKIGGTSQVVRYFRSGLPIRFTPNAGHLTFPNNGYVIHILTRRLSAFESFDIDKIGTSENLWHENPQENHDDLLKNWKNIINQLGNFNNDTTHFIVNHTKEINESLSYLLGNNITIEQLDKRARNIINLYAVSDAMSIDAQKKRHRSFLWLITIALFIIGGEQIYGIFMDWGILASSLVAGFIAYLYFLQIDKQRLETKYLDYRALAEGLRIQFFWHIAGLHECTADYFLRDQKDELEWIRLAMQSTELQSEPHTNPNIQLVLDNWIKDQRIYFLGDTEKGAKGLGKAQKNFIYQEKLFKKIRVVFLMGLTVLISTVIFHGALYDSFSSEWRDYLLNSMIALYGILFWAVPTMKLYLDFQAYDEQAKRYLRIGGYYKLCEKRLGEALNNQDDEIAADLILEMGKHALNENDDWLQLHRQRPPQIPVI